jgi:hypothetical protein
MDVGATVNALCSTITDSDCDALETALIPDNVGVGDSFRSATRPAEHHMPTYKDKAVQPRAIDIITRTCGIVVNKALQLF